VRPCAPIPCRWPGSRPGSCRPADRVAVTPTSVSSERVARYARGPGDIAHAHGEMLGRIIQEVLFQGLADGRKRQLLPGNFRLAEQSDLKTLFAGGEIQVGQLPAEEHVDLV